MKLSDNMVRAFADAEDIMHAANGASHEYWLGKCVGMADAVAILLDVDWITAHNMLGKAAYHMRQSNAA